MHIQSQVFVCILNAGKPNILQYYWSPINCSYGAIQNREQKKRRQTNKRQKQKLSQKCQVHENKHIYFSITENENCRKLDDIGECLGVGNICLWKINSLQMEYYVRQ